MATCSSCGNEVPEGSRFCNVCGAALAESPSAPALEERKVVSVLFCDLVGFTAASEQVDPEDVRARLRPYHQRLRSEIESYGGTVEKFGGAAVMAAFGASAAYEDDAARAARASGMAGDGLGGRERGKSLLIGTFERTAQQRSCQRVAIVGEPGVGKSRLCAELLQYVEDGPALSRWRQGHCLPYGEGTTFWSLGEIVKAECGIL